MTHGDGTLAAERYAATCFRVVARAIDGLASTEPELRLQERAAAEIAALMGVAARKAIVHVRHHRDVAAAAFAMSAYDVFITAREAIEP
jgi:DNA-binding LytR/AlgR family response regulator